MKQFYILLVGLLLLTSCFGQKIGYHIPTKEESNYFQVLKIDSLAKNYIIYAARRDSLFKIVSKKVEMSKDCNQLISGKFYDLNPMSIIDSGFGNKFFIDGITILGDFISLKDRGIIRDIFFSSKLKGLCFLK